MIFVYLLVLLSGTILPQTVWGIQIKDERGNCELSLPNGWKYERNLFGLPHVFLSPGETRKVSVSLTFTGLQAVKLPSFELMKNQEQYQHGRKEWANKRGIVITSFHPYVKNSVGGIVFHQIGVNYKSNIEEQSERSYFFECPNSLIHLKAVGPKASIHFKEALSLIETLRCQN